MGNFGPLDERREPERTTEVVNLPKIEKLTQRVKQLKRNGIHTKSLIFDMTLLLYRLCHHNTNTEPNDQAVIYSAFLEGR